MVRQYNFFVSHSWTYSEEYTRFVNLLESRGYFNFKNYSVPDVKGLDTTTDTELRGALWNQIRPTHIVIILAGMYVNHSQWIQIEMEIALGMGKPMIGIKPHGNQLTPVQVSSSVKEVVNWNTDSIVEAIRRYALN